MAEQHFGYKSVYLGCTVTYGIGMYNEVMENYLDKINGKDWRIKEQQMRDSIIKSDSLKWQAKAANSALAHMAGRQTSYQQLIAYQQQFGQTEFYEHLNKFLH